MGRMTFTSGVSTGAQILARAEAWPFRVRFLTDYDQDQALSYLEGGPRLAVMPSLADNSPCVVYECMERGIPFLACSGSGADELIDPDCLPEVTVPPSAARLAERIVDVIHRGALRAWPSYDTMRNLDTWSAWHRTVASMPISETRPQPATASDAEEILFVVIDDGEGPLGGLMDRVRDMLRLAGDEAGVMMLSPRASLVDRLVEAWSGEAALPVVVAGPDAADEAAEAIADADIVLIADATTEVLTPFVVTAMRMIREGNAAIVSAVTAVADPDGTLSIREIPHGDAPGIATLFATRGGAVWVFGREALAATPLDLIDVEEGQFRSARSLGERTALAATDRGSTFALVPTIGAITRDETSGRRGRSLLYDEARAIARLLDVPESVYGGGAPWVALSRTLSARGDTTLPPIVPTAVLGDDHPLHTAETSSRPALLAAATGRPKLAVGIAADEMASADEIEEVMAVARSAAIHRPRYELAGLIVPEGAPHLDIRTDHTAGTAAQAEGVAQVPASARLIREGSVTSKRPGRVSLAGEAKMLIVDLPLVGHRQVTAQVSGDVAAVEFSAALIDQRSGRRLAVASARPQGGTASLAMTLPWDLAGPFALELTLRPAAGDVSGNNIVFERLSVH